MRVGIFADTHDHLDNVRWAVDLFNQEQCSLVLFAGDFVSTFVTPPLRRLRCPFVGCYGDNDGNKRGLTNGIALTGGIAEPPVGIPLPDGTRVLLTHMVRDLHGLCDGADVIVYAHTHRPAIHWDAQGRLFINPGETSGWTYRQPTVALLETNPLGARILPLPPMPPIPQTHTDFSRATIRE